MAIIGLAVFFAWPKNNLTPAGLSRIYGNSGAEIKNNYKLENTRLILPAKDKDGVEVALGSPDSETFAPELEISRWDREASLKLKPDFVVSDKNELVTEGEKIKYTTPEAEYHFYTKPDGAYEFEVVYAKKPASNVVEIPMESENLDFFYQPALNQEKHRPEVASCTETQCFDKDGKVITERPENVVGSYAVYYKDGKSGDYTPMGGKNYMTGKAFHIYRPQIFDAAGNKVWGELKIDKDNKKLAVTVPQDFLDQAVYPVTVDPTFGYYNGGTPGGSVDYWAAARVAFSKSPNTPSSNGIISSMTIFGNCFTGPAHFYPALYSDNSGSPDTKIASVETGESAASFSTDYAWVTTNITANISSGTQYWLGHSTLSEDHWHFAYDSTAGSDERGATPFTSWPSSISSTDNYQERVSIYATYYPHTTYANTPANSSNPPSLNDGLVGYWSFNGPDMEWASTTAEVLDRSGQDNNGNLVGAKADIGVDGNQGMSFDGVDDYINIGSTSAINSLTNNFTVSAWIKPNNLTGIKRIVSSVRINSPNNGFALGTNDAGIRFTTLGVHDYNSTAITLSDNIWFYVTAVMNSDNSVTFYLNGENKETVVFGSPGSQSNDVFLIGTGGADGAGDLSQLIEQFNGMIDEVKIYNRALSEAEIGELYQMGAKRAKINEPITNYATTGLVGSWTFNGPDVAGTIAYDRSGQGNDGTINGALPAIGKVGQGMSFDGSGQYVDIPDIVEGLSQITITVWVKSKVADSSVTQYILDQTSGATDAGGLIKDALEEFRCKIVNDDQTQQEIISSVFADTDWHYLTCIYNGAEVDLFVDGELVDSSNPLTGIIETAASDNLVISDTYATSDWDGLIDEVRIYNTALTADEVRDLYELGSRKVEIRQ